MSERRSRLDRSVGPVLDAGDMAQSIVDAIISLNETVEILDRGSYWRILVPDRCVLTREALAEHLSAELDWPGDLEIVMPSFTGRLTLTDERAVWESAAR